MVDSQFFPAFASSRHARLLHYNTSFVRTLRLFVDNPASISTRTGHQLMLELQPYVVDYDRLNRFYQDRLFHEHVRGSDKSAPQIEHFVRQLGRQAYVEESRPQVFEPLELSGRGHTLRLKLLTMTLGPPQDVALRNFPITPFSPATVRPTRSSTSWPAARPVSPRPS
ncbi:MAG: hypothetical protein AAGA56_24640 [Myxococcota bacterium]